MPREADLAFLVSRQVPGQIHGGPPFASTSMCYPDADLSILSRRVAASVRSWAACGRTAAGLRLQDTDRIDGVDVRVVSGPLLGRELTLGAPVGQLINPGLHLWCAARMAASASGERDVHPLPDRLEELREDVRRVRRARIELMVLKHTISERPCGYRVSRQVDPGPGQGADAARGGVSVVLGRRYLQGRPGE